MTLPKFTTFRTPKLREAGCRLCAGALASFLENYNSLPAGELALVLNDPCQ